MALFFSSLLLWQCGALSPLLAADVTGKAQQVQAAPGKPAANVKPEKTAPVQTAKIAPSQEVSKENLKNAESPKNAPKNSETNPDAAGDIPAAAAKVTPDAARQKVETYASFLDGWLTSPEPHTFEPVLAKGQAAAEAILAAEEAMAPDVFDKLGKQMRGYMVERTELVITVPDAGWLKEQSAQHGTPADVAFFDLMGQTLNGYWPITMEQLSDLSGCSRYGSHDLVRLYGAWKKFEKTFPGAYETALKDPKLLLLADIEDQLINGQSACESPESVMDEFQTFITAYPDSNLTPKLKKRLDEVKKGISDMAFYQGNRYNGASDE